MAWGTQGVDFEVRVDYDKLRKERLSKARAQMERAGLGAILCLDPNNVRYLTSTHLGEWSRDKFTRYCVLPRGGDPVLFDFGSAVKVKKQHNPWIADHVRPAVGWMRGAVPQLESSSDRFMEEIVGILSEYGVQKEPLGIDLADATLLEALRKSRLEVADGQDAMLEARLRKSPDEIQLLKAAAAMAD
ncbi:MAG TPA: aminopeptidase P family N-terminal domain-containing protein, partial [Chloroflexota bacterium]|nr:aminopeptidase P family N-terminal domain-containing protein [Chloroflexota bacterium]